MQVDHITFVQVNDLISGAGQCHGIRCEKIFAFADADNQRRSLSCADDAMWFVAAKHRNRIGAMQALDRLLHGVEQVARIQRVDQMGNHFGIGLAFKCIAGGLQFCAQLVMVFDNAVVHQGDPLA